VVACIASVAKKHLGRIVLDATVNTLFPLFFNRGQELLHLPSAVCFRDSQQRVALKLGTALESTIASFVLLHGGHYFPVGSKLGSDSSQRLVVEG
jgi:hypothetical protein